MDCSLTGSSVHETFQARVLEWGATAFSGLVAKLYSVLLDSINCSTQKSFVLHYLSEFAHIRIYWVSDAILSSSVALFSCPHSFPASESFPMSRLFASGGQSIGASTSVLSMNIHSWFLLGLTGLIPLLSTELSRVFSSTTIPKHQFFSAQSSLWSNSYSHLWLLKKTIALTIWTFVGKVMSLLLNTLSRFVIAFLPRSSLQERNKDADERMDMWTHSGERGEWDVLGE